MTEIVVDIVSVSILHIEIGFYPTFSRHDRIEASFILFIWLNEKVLISFGHRMGLRYMSYHVKTFFRSALPLGSSKNLTGLVYQDESVITYLRPFRSNAVQISSFGKEMTTHGIGRDDNLSLLIML